MAFTLRILSICLLISSLNSTGIGRALILLGFPDTLIFMVTVMHFLALGACQTSLNSMNNSIAFCFSSSDRSLVQELALFWTASVTLEKVVCCRVSGVATAVVSLSFSAKLY